LKFAIADLVCSENRVINWDNVKVLDLESDKTGRLIREAMG